MVSKYGKYGIHGNVPSMFMTWELQRVVDYL